MEESKIFTDVLMYWIYRDFLLPQLDLFIFVRPTILIQDKLWEAGFFIPKQLPALNECDTTQYNRVTLNPENVIPKQNDWFAK